jgi:hypothetical protein
VNDRRTSRRNPGRAQSGGPFGFGFGGGSSGGSGRSTRSGRSGRRARTLGGVGRRGSGGGGGGDCRRASDLGGCGCAWAHHSSRFVSALACSCFAVPALGEGESNRYTLRQPAQRTALLRTCAGRLASYPQYGQTTGATDRCGTAGGLGDRGTGGGTDLLDDGVGDGGPGRTGTGGGAGRGVGAGIVARTAAAKASANARHSG